MNIFLLSQNRQELSYIHRIQTVVWSRSWIGLCIISRRARNGWHVDRPGIVHRLDKDTSGLMVVPRTHYAHKYFSTLFRDRQIHKTYYAVVHGHPDAQGTIDFSVGRHPEQRTKMHAFPHDYRQDLPMRSAVTHYTVLEYFADSALVELKPVTGRTHQIRVHCTALGHPLIGDPVYGTKIKKNKAPCVTCICALVYLYGSTIFF